MTLTENNNKLFLSQYNSWLYEIYPEQQIEWGDYYKELPRNLFKKKDVQKNYLFSGDINFNAHVLKYIKSLTDKYQSNRYSGAMNLLCNQYGCAIFDTYDSDVTDDMYTVEAISEIWFEMDDNNCLDMFIPNIDAGLNDSRELVVAEINDLGELIMDC